MTLKFGKHRGLTLDQLLKNGEDGYIQWLSTQDFVNDKMKTYIKTNILRKTKLQFGRNKGMNISDLEDGYVEWMKNNITQPWIQLL
jgi:uncharacterized protein (DUF3820 family)